MILNLYFYYFNVLFELVKYTSSDSLPLYISSAKYGLIGQKTCYKTAIAIEISMAIAVLSFLKEDKGWTKNVFRMLVNS